METRQTTNLLSGLGICPAYKGYPYLVFAIGIAADNYQSVFPRLKDLYQQTAANFSVTPSIVEHDIRTILRSYWNQNNAKRFSHIVGYPVQDRLTTREFISIVAEHISLQK